MRAAAERRGEPFFLALGFVKPHLPFTALKKYWDLYDPERFPWARRQTPPEGAPAYAGKTLAELNQYDPIPEWGLLAPDLQRLLIPWVLRVCQLRGRANWPGAGGVGPPGPGDQYDRGVVGRSRMASRRSRDVDEAHELRTGEPNSVDPCGAGPGRTGATRQVAETVDLYPTLVELAGLSRPKVPQPLEGESLVPVLRDPSVRVRDHAWRAYPRRRAGEEVIGRAIRTERYRLVEWKVPGAPADTADLELYDYEEDPEETRNLAAEARRWWHDCGPS